MFHIFREKKKIKSKITHILEGNKKKGGRRGRSGGAGTGDHPRIALPCGAHG